VLPLSTAKQQKTMVRTRDGVRKIIVSTNIAKTSVTIDGVEAGYVKLIQYDPDRCIVAPISKVTLEGAPAGIVYNTDKVGFNEWVDGRKVYVTVPASYPEQKTDNFNIRLSTRHSSIHNHLHRRRWALIETGFRYAAKDS
jgi:hypothetical protein